MSAVFNTAVITFVITLPGDHMNLLVSPPRKLRSKNPKVALSWWQKLRKKIWKSCAKVVRNFAHY